jgi:putative glutamine amidotransferase
MHDTVLIVTGRNEKPDQYVEACKTGGFAAERLRVIQPAPEIRRDARRLAAEAAGVVLCGGSDIHPRYFGEAEISEAHLEIEEDRDEMEWEVFEGARDAHTPVFGVCRGAQVLNVFLGGDLWQDLPHQKPGSLLHHLSYPRDALVHTVTVTAPDTWLGDVLARETALVNSRHHQGIRRLAAGLIPVGHAPDHLIEALSLASEDWWLHAVQWHPENLVPMAQSRALWRGFAAAVERHEHLRHDFGPADPQPVHA